MEPNNLNARELTALRRRNVDLREELIDLGWLRDTVRRYMDDLLSARR
jgi:hypothetical protein